MTPPEGQRGADADRGAALEPVRRAGQQRMRLRYGFNEVDGWWGIGLGPHRERIRHHHRLMGTEVVRVFVFDKPVPDPVTEWDLFAAYIQAVLDMGAVPMITFAKYHPPHDEPRNLRTYLARCADVVWGCLEQWGGERVRDWYWCVWNEPNNYNVGGGLTFPLYRRIYEEVAHTVRRLLEPYLGGRKVRIGGPALCGFQTYWLDWVVRARQRGGPVARQLHVLAPLRRLAAGGAERQPWGSTSRATRSRRTGPPIARC